MIRAKFSRVREGLQLEMRDHATGSEAVCAGASAIVYALGGYLLNRAPEGLGLNLRAGDAWVQCRRCQETETAFEVARVGLLQLEKTYPEYIQVEVVE